MKSVENTPHDNILMLGYKTPSGVNTNHVKIGYDEPLITVSNLIPFILAFIEESGVDKREVIGELVTEDDAEWLLDLSVWNQHKDNPNHDEGSTPYISRDEFTRLQSKFGREG